MADGLVERARERLLEDGTVKEGVGAEEEIDGRRLMEGVGEWHKVIECGRKRLRIRVLRVSGLGLEACSEIARKRGESCTIP